MEICLHNSGSNVIGRNSLDTIIAKAVEKPKLGGASLNKNNIFCYCSERRVVLVRFLFCDEDY